MVHFLLIGDWVRLLDITGAGDGKLWRYDLYNALFSIIQRNAMNRPDYLKQRLTDMLNNPAFDLSLRDITQCLKFCLTVT